MKNDVRRLRMLSDYLTSEALCDALAEMKYDGHPPGVFSSMLNARFLGRAKTLRLRSLRENEDPDGIYRALESYNEIAYNDVIVVETEAPRFAYFGELNAILAKQQGAAGVVIGGCSRDSGATDRMNFPVFSHGPSPCDCKGKVTLDSVGQPVVIDRVKVSQNDLVFADEGGVVVIPSLIEDAVISEVIEAISREASIRRTLLDSTIQDAISLYGTF